MGITIKRAAHYDSGNTDEGFDAGVFGNANSIDITEGVIIAETLFKTIGKSISDGIYAAETIVKTIGKSISDGIYAAETIVKNIGKNITDGIKVAEAISKGVGKIFTDGVTIADYDTGGGYITPGNNGGGDPGSWDILNNDWDDVTGWNVDIVGTGGDEIAPAGELHMWAGDLIKADIDYIRRYQKPGGISAGSDYTLQVRFKPTGLANYITHHQMIEPLVIYGGTCYVWIGIYLDKITYRDSSGPAIFTDIDPAITNGNWYLLRLIFKQSTRKHIKVYLSDDDGVTWKCMGSSISLYPFSSGNDGQVEIGVYEDWGLGQIDVQYDYYKIATSAFIPSINGWDIRNDTGANIANSENGWALKGVPHAPYTDEEDPVGYWHAAAGASGDYDSDIRRYCSHGGFAGETQLTVEFDLKIDSIDTYVDTNCGQFRIDLFNDYKVLTLWIFADQIRYQGEIFGGKLCDFTPSYGSVKTYRFTIDFDTGALNFYEGNTLLGTTADGYNTFWGYGGYIDLACIDDKGDATTTDWHLGNLKIASGIWPPYIAPVYYVAKLFGKNIVNNITNIKDIIKLAETWDRTVTFCRSFTDITFVVESYNKFWAILKNFTDGIKAIEALLVARCIHLNLKDGIKVTDWGKGRFVMELWNILCGWKKRKIIDLFYGLWDYLKTSVVSSKFTKTSVGTDTWSKSGVGTTAFTKSTPASGAWTKTPTITCPPP